MEGGKKDHLFSIQTASINPAGLPGAAKTKEAHHAETHNCLAIVALGRGDQKSKSFHSLT